MERIKFMALSGFQPKQKEAKEAVMNKKYILYGGAAGGGKSYWLRWMALYLLLYYHAKTDLNGIRIGLFCEDYPALRERHLSKIPFEFPRWLGDLHEGSHEFRIKQEYGGGVVAFRNLDDPSKYLSSEFASILVDELTKNKRDVFDFLNMRMRWPGISETKFIGATNPGEIGHSWVKKLWINKDFSEEKYDPNDFVFIKSLYKDNKFIDISYEKQLDSLPESMRRAYKDGDWDVFSGQFFTEFRQDHHVCEPFKIPEDWPRVIGLDYGYSAPSALVWLAYDRAFKTLYLYRELYMKGLTYNDLANEIIKSGDKARLIIADPAIFAKKDSPISGATQMQDTLGKDYKIWPAKNERVIGWGAVREYLKTYEIDGVVKGRLRIFDTCRNMIRTFPELVYDKIHTEDVDSEGDDHLADALRYAIMYYRDKKIQEKPNSYEIGTEYLRKKENLFDRDEFAVDDERMFTF